MYKQTKSGQEQDIIVAFWRDLVCRGGWKKKEK
jgi:hypothetical protein